MWSSKGQAEVEFVATEASVGADYLAYQLPLSVRIALLAVFIALGIIFRQIAIPSGLPDVMLTPGFIIPLLTGMVLGPVEGMICGLFVGISGGFSEPFVLPVLGNIALGFSTGILTFVRRRLPRLLWAGLCIVLGTCIGGFLPTFTVKTLLYGSYVAIASASIDAAQAAIWVVVVLILDIGVVQPLLIRLLGQEMDLVAEKAQ